nr:hypothetical protein [Vibrio vulnificus]
MHPLTQRYATNWQVGLFTIRCRHFIILRGGLMPLGKQEIFEALKNAAYKVSAENFFLTEDLDSPIYPESLVQIEAAKSLKSMLPYSVVKLEFAVSDIEKLLGAGITGQTDRTNGYADITFSMMGSLRRSLRLKMKSTGLMMV